MRLARTKMVRQEFFSRKLVPTSDAIKRQLKGRGEGGGEGRGMKIMNRLKSRVDINNM